MLGKGERQRETVDKDANQAQEDEEKQMKKKEKEEKKKKKKNKKKENFIRGSSQIGKVSSSAARPRSAINVQRVLKID